MDMAHSLKQFKAALRVLFYPEGPEDRVLQKYMDIGAFVVAIDKGREHIQLKDEERWARTIQSGMTIVMSVIMTQEVYHITPTEYECPFCECWNNLKGDNGQSSIDCQSCKRQFQVTLPDEGTYEPETATVANNERDLIQNIYLRQKRTNLISQWTMDLMSDDVVVYNQSHSMLQASVSDLISAFLNSKEDDLY